MQDIINSINEAEVKASEIKLNAQAKCAEIAQKAETDADEIAKRCETDCKIYRETEIRKAEAKAEEDYRKAISVKRAEAGAYADNILKNTDAEVNEIVRRITRGSR
ncbi:MAG: hypothetical protein HDQ88_10370 [Clostridia bacterium]|nr:hypothetical protein [Clostridia bacterium]